jgi:hypothetical protein
MKKVKFGKGGITTAEGRATGAEARRNARMAEIDRYLKDPDTKLVKTASGKLQFRDAKPKAKVASPAARDEAQARRISRPVAANAVPGKQQTAPKTGGGSVATPARKTAPSMVGAGTLESRARAAKKEPASADSKLELAKDIATGVGGVALGLLPVGRALKAGNAIRKFVGARRAAAAVKRRVSPERVSRANQALRDKVVTPDEASDMAMGYRKGGKVSKKEVPMKNMKRGGMAMDPEYGEANPFGKDTVNVLNRIKKNAGKAATKAPNKTPAKVPTKKYAHGGMVKGAHGGMVKGASRGDGCAQRGKTKGMMR